MPLEEEVAVDPQMIGYVYESLANVAEEIYDRHDLGIFYTPRIEVDFMARRVLSEYLSKNLEEIPKQKLYKLIFNPPEDKREIIEDFDEKFWRKFEDVLDNLSAVDPACGSGAFLVGLLNVLTELYRITYLQLDRKASDFELKKRIIQYSLYGVDIMPWAIHAAELRLWLQLMVETELKREELRQYPLLPNLDLNLRIGDSLVQEIGGFFFNLRTNDLDLSIRKKLSNLKNEKRNYFDNLPRAKFKSPEEVKEEELIIFEEIIEIRLKILVREINQLKDNVKRAKSQKDLYGNNIFDKKKIKILEDRIREKHIIIERLNNIKNVINIPEKKPFIWDIDFAEIFGDKNGFDIVIGNPPYVRQEDIIPFDKLKTEVSDREKKQYKVNLVKSVKNQFPMIMNLDGRSDYYIYFYFHGLSLLNENGTFCFITSNSWLDVGYGRELQEFLLKYVPIIAIYDNPKRSFEHAEINTIIALFGSPLFKKDKFIAGLRVKIGRVWTCLENSAKFIMFKKPFEEVIKTRNLVELDEIKVKETGDYVKLIKNIVSTNDYRILPVLQNDLLEDGWDYPKDYYPKKDHNFKRGKYSGNQWGGKYLKAPDIYFTILNKSENILKALEPDIAKVITVGWTREGKNKEIFQTKKQYDKKPLSDIKDEVIKSPKELTSISFKKEDTKYYLIKKEILKNRLITAPLLWVDIRGDKHICHLNSDLIYFSHNFHGIIPTDKSNVNIICGLLNSTFTWLFIETLGRKGLGGGGLRILVNDLKKLKIILDPNAFNQIERKLIEKTLKKIAFRKIKSVFVECGLDNSKPILEQDPNPLKDREELDRIIFDKINLTEQERKDVYLYTCKLAKERIDKVKSIKV